MATLSKVFQVSDDDLLLHILDASDDLSSLDDSESDSADCESGDFSIASAFTNKKRENDC